MNKKEVSMIMTGVTGMLLCNRWVDFRKWAEERFNRNIDLDVFGRPLSLTSEEVWESITVSEWNEISNFFIGSEKKKS